MRVIEGTTIKINRGDILPLKLQIPIYNEETGELDHYYQFKVGDKIDFGVYYKKKMSGNALLLKSYTIEEETDAFEFTLSSEDMKIGELIDKPTDYWYEVELNDNQTVIGYDDNGAKILRLYPEGSEIV